MRLFTPDYYPRFTCIAGACRHSCCIGWEIDIDEETLALYRELPAPLGERVRKSLVTNDGVTCFRLVEGERCPHLNAQGLCEIILGAGEDYLSQICYDHPRFRNYFSDRVEMGLGLTCEAAARLILTHRPGLTYTCVEDDGEREGLSQFEEIKLHLRREYISIAQDRTLSIQARLEKLTTLTRMSLPDARTWAEYLMTLERLDPAWGDRLAPYIAAEPRKTGTSLPWQDVACALEQFLVYLLYRHVADAADTETVRAYLAFAVATTRLMIDLFLSCTTIEELIDLGRMWSSEIEYSTENVAACVAYFMRNDGK